MADWKLEMNIKKERIEVASFKMEKRKADKVHWREGAVELK